MTIKLVVGLGNPGDKYERTRHNAGCWLVERFAGQSGTPLRKDAKFQALVGRHAPSGAWLLIPQTFMNVSGRAVQLLASFFKIQPAEILVVHDELDFAPGVAKIKQGGGTAGHNGLKDISARLGSHDYWRLRIGIGHPGSAQEVTDYVLHKPEPEERAEIDAAMARALEVLPLALADDLQGAMLKLHTQEKAEAAAPPAPAAKKEQAKKSKAVEPAAKPAEAEKPARPAKAAPEPAARKAESPGTLSSFFKKFLPGSDPKRKK